MTTRAPAVLKMFGGAEVMCLAMTRYVFSQQHLWPILLHPDCVGGRREQPHGHLDHSPSLHQEPLALKGLLENNVHDIYLDQESLAAKDQFHSYNDKNTKPKYTWDTY